MKKTITALLTACLSCIAFCQSAQTARISAQLEKYFELDRENIALHLNKQEYLNTEKIWVKGYITKKQDGLPLGSTANVFVNLIDSGGKIRSSNLMYAEQGIFSGNIPLSATLPTGIYYIQAFTNFMNNFSEDESAVYEIAIANPVDNKSVNRNAVDYSSAALSFFPESGIFLENADNTMAVRLNDCRGNGISTSGEILDAKANTVATFTTNSQGYARFDLPSDKKGPFTAAYRIGESTVKKNLPQTVPTGIAMSVNTYAFKDKAIVTVKTNSQTLPMVRNEPYTLVIQQHGSASYAEIRFSDSTTQTLSLPMTTFPEGVSTIFLIDKNGKKIADRLVFKPRGADLKTTFEFQKRSDSIVARGSSPLKLASLSVSVLPSDAAVPMLTIDGQSEIGNYLESGITNAAYYLSDFSRKKHFELDNLLIASRPKYTWEGIMGAPPARKYPFDQGIDIKGTINSATTLGSEYSVRMNSIALGINERTKINNKNEFVFEHVLAIDSTSVNFSVVDAKDRISPYKFTLQLLNNKRIFYKPLRLPQDCNAALSDVADGTFPKIQGQVMLDAVEVKAKKKETLSHANKSAYNNSVSRGFKIDEQAQNSYRDVLGFIRANGFNVTTNGMNVSISRPFARSFGGATPPAIFLDDMQVTDFTQLLYFDLNRVDEIYINRNGFGGGGTIGAGGIIHIYTKTNFGVEGKTTTKWQNFKILGGYRPDGLYENPDFAETHSEAFRRYGSIHWVPRIDTDASGFFKFSFPDLHQPSITIVVEGIASDGSMISEVHTLTP